MKVSVIFGTRPEAVKMAPLVLALREHPSFSCHVCVTSQHREMLDQILFTFGIVPDTDLDVMEPNQTLSGLTARVLQAVDGYLCEEEPDLVIVQGDTTTVLATTLAAFYNHIPVGHVEAGMRSGDMFAPWPEEANRILAARLVSLHFVPIEANRDILLKEGVNPKQIFVTGNPVIDALRLTVEKAREQAPAIPGLPPDLISGEEPLVLITGHRRESFGSGFESICQSIATLAERFPDVSFVYPVHLNPNVLEPVNRILKQADEQGQRYPNIHLIEPLSYLPFVALMNRATMVLTDSGGVQEESACLGKPTLVMRDTTERPEALEFGTVKLVGSNSERIVEQVSLLLTDNDVFTNMAKPFSMYGEGQSTQRILDACLEWDHTRKR